MFCLPVKPKARRWVPADELQELRNFANPNWARELQEFRDEIEPPMKALMLFFRSVQRYWVRRTMDRIPLWRRG
jgi:hypothetical protein